VSHLGFRRSRSHNSPAGFKIEHPQGMLIAPIKVGEIRTNASTERLLISLVSARLCTAARQP
jgi:hypothetical protein